MPTPLYWTVPNLHPGLLLVPLVLLDMSEILVTKTLRKTVRVMHIFYIMDNGTTWHHIIYIITYKFIIKYGSNIYKSPLWIAWFYHVGKEILNYDHAFPSQVQINIIYGFSTELRFKCRKISFIIECSSWRKCHSKVHRKYLGSAAKQNFSIKEEKNK